MGYLIVAIIFILILSGGITLFNRLKKRKLGIILSIIIFLIFISIPISLFFESLFFTHQKAKEILEKHNIILSNDFEFINKDISRSMDYVLQFELTISNNDKERIIKSFINSPYRKNIDPLEMYDIRYLAKTDLLKDTVLYTIYEGLNYWNLQYCKILPNGYIQTWDFIQISKNNNELKFIRNE